MQLFFPAEIKKKEVFNKIENYLIGNDFLISNKDDARPWGGFFVIDEYQSHKFIEKYFPEFKTDDLLTGKKLSPKILIVEPEKKLSWQYHHRRAEWWKVISGEVGIITSETNEEGELKKYNQGSVIKLKKGERHRLVGLNCWGIVAEIWQHTDSANPSDENDIVRLLDDYGR